MSSGARLRRTPPPLFRPEGLQVAPGVGSQACRKSRAARLSLVGRGARLNVGANVLGGKIKERSEEHTSELQSLMRISYAVSCLKKKKPKKPPTSGRTSKHCPDGTSSLTTHTSTAS